MEIKATTNSALKRVRLSIMLALYWLAALPTPKFDAISKYIKMVALYGYILDQDN